LEKADKNKLFLVATTPRDSWSMKKMHPFRKSAEQKERNF
jgi:hypothetical protein